MKVNLPGHGDANATPPSLENVHGLDSMLAKSSTGCASRVGPLPQVSALGRTFRLPPTELNWKGGLGS